MVRANQKTVVNRRLLVIYRTFCCSWRRLTCLITTNALVRLGLRLALIERAPLDVLVFHLSESDRHFIAAWAVITSRISGGFRVFGVVDHTTLEQKLVAELLVTLVHGSTAVLLGNVQAVRALTWRRGHKICGATRDLLLNCSSLLFLDVADRHDERFTFLLCQA